MCLFCDVTRSGGCQAAAALGDALARRRRAPHGPDGARPRQRRNVARRLDRQSQQVAGVAQVSARARAHAQRLVARQTLRLLSDLLLLL